jgi:hypothetical protein
MIGKLTIRALILFAVLLALGGAEVESSVLERQGQVTRTLNRHPIRPEATGLWQRQRLEDDREHGAPADRLEYERGDAHHRPYRYYPMPDDVFWFGR